MGRRSAVRGSAMAQATMMATMAACLKRSAVIRGPSLGEPILRCSDAGATRSHGGNELARMTKTPAGRHRSNRLSGLDIAVALVVAGVTLALYVATLQPDFGGPEDTPKFQFLGFVLGTAHPPGYPLYVLLSHLFVQLPVGPIAYRANLFSAVMASAACGLTCLIGRQTGAGRIAAACAALALAAGASFWRSAVFAEVYSLASAVVALAVLLLLEWDARGGVRWLLGSVAALSLGLGNHLTIIGAVPAFVCTS